MSLPARCPAHPEAHVMHTWATHRMETNSGGYVGIVWEDAHMYRCAVCQRELANNYAQLAAPEKESSRP